MPPGPVTGFQVIDVTARSITLSWQASGDDGTIGTAKKYDLRYATTPITESTFPLATPVPNLPTPTRPGTTQAVLVYNLRSDTGYHFALRVEDEARNPSPLAHLAPMTTSADTIPPAAITDLVVASTTPTSFTLAWTAPGDDGNHGQVDGYEIRYATVPLDDVGWDSARHVAEPVPPLPAGQRQSVEISGLPSRRTLYLAVRARDAAENLSPLSNIRAARITGVPRTWYVRQNGTGDMIRIQTGIDSSADGDTVLVAAGRYNELLNFKGRNLVLRSQDGSEETILDGIGLLGPVITLENGESQAAVIEGFTITNGVGVRPSEGNPNRRGGGIYCREASPTIRGNIIRDNHPTGQYSNGGGIGVFGPFEPGPETHPVIIDNLIENNSVGHAGGGITLFYSSGTLRRNVIRNNRCNYDGAGMWGFLHRGSITISSCEFIGNVAGDHGGAIEMGNSIEGPGPHYTITNSLFAWNRAEGRDVPERDAGSGGALSVRGTQGVLSHNTFAFNHGIRQSSNCTGGSVLVDHPAGRLEFSWNIFFGSEGCGMACYTAPDVIIENNLFWSNTPSDLGHVGPPCGGPDFLTRNVFADPRFCDPGSGNYRLLQDSPARIGGEVIGAFALPSCANASRVP